MKIDKEQIASMLKDHGDQDKADRAQQELPDQVDPDQHRDRLDTLGIGPEDLPGGAGLAGRFGG